MFLAPTIREAWLGRADIVLAGYFTRVGDQVVFHAVLEDGDSHKVKQTLESRGGARGVVPASEAMAREMDRRMRPLGTQSGAAVEAWGQALIATTPVARVEALKRSLAADRNFGIAYVDLAQILLQMNDRPGAEAVIAEGRQRLAALGDVDRARLELLDATLHDNPGERRTALVALSRLITTDANTLVSLASIEMQGRRFQAAVDFYKSALALEPDRTSLLNDLGYAEAYRGNLDGARAAFERYHEAQPKDANSFDSLGEVNYFLGQFEDAEKSFLEAEKLSPSFHGGVEFVKSAQARLMRGDVNGADGFFQKYLEIRRRAGDPLAAVEQAQWWYLSGRRKQALDALSRMASGDGIGAYASAQLSLWLLNAGDRQGAADAAARGLQTPNPPVRNLAALGAFLSTSRSGLDDWNRAADVALPGLGQLQARRRAVAMGLLFSKQFETAIPVLKDLYAATIPSFDGETRTLYGWALVEAGRTGEAAPLVELYPIAWSETADPAFSWVAFPRFLAVRAAVRQTQGKTDEARGLQDLFRRFSQ